MDILYLTTTISDMVQSAPIEIDEVNMTSWRRWLLLAVGLTISAIFIYIALDKLNLSEVWKGLQSANYWWIIPGVAVYFVAVWARTWRWHYLLRPIQRVSLRELFPVVVIGYMGNNVYPFRAGEVIRAWALKRNAGVSISASLATIIVERIFDGLVMLLFVFAALPFARIPPPYDQIVIWMTALFVSALASFFALALRPEFTRRLYHAAFTRFVPVEGVRVRVIAIADRFMDGLSSLRSPADLAMTLVTSVVIWLTETTKYWFVMHAFNFEVSFFVLMLMTAVVNLATTLPSSPGYVGTFDTPGIAVLSAFGVDANVAAAYTLVLHAALWLPITLLGVYYMIRQGIRWGDFARASSEVGGVYKIVCILNDSNTITLITSILQRKLGIELLGTIDGLVGWNLILSARPDLILLDWMVIGINGFEVLERLKSDPELRRIPIIAISARGDREFIDQCLETGIKDYITLPFSPHVLVESVGTVLNLTGLEGT